VIHKCPIDGCRAQLGDLARLDAHLAAEHNVTRAELHEQKRREFEREQLFNLIHRRERMRSWTLDTFPADDVAGRRALAAARTWLATGEQPRIYVYGPPGTGKTGLAFAMARYWIESISERVLFENVRALLAAQRAGFAHTDSTSDNSEPTPIEKLLDTYGDGEIVVLDDLGAERPTEYALETVALIVEHLHANDVPLIVTTNYAPAALAKRLGHADLVVGQRIVSRLVEDALRIELDRRDLRMRAS
jgi:DNA replication protein DnaC